MLIRLVTALLLLVGLSACVQQGPGGYPPEGLAAGGGDPRQQMADGQVYPCDPTNGMPLPGSRKTCTWHTGSRKEAVTGTSGAKARTVASSAASVQTGVFHQLWREQLDEAQLALKDGQVYDCDPATGAILQVSAYTCTWTHTRAKVPCCRKVETEKPCCDKGGTVIAKTTNSPRGASTAVRGNNNCTVTVTGDNNIVLPCPAGMKGKGATIVAPKPQPTAPSATAVPKPAGFYNVNYQEDDT